MYELLNVFSVSFFLAQHLNIKARCWIKSSEQEEFSHATALITLDLLTATMSHCHIRQLQRDRK
jgi:hypothetical protein